MKKFFYRVLDGDTVISVAEKFKIPVGSIIELNSLNEESSCGDLLYLEKECKRAYRVKPFDTPQSISEKFNLSETEILKKNNVLYLFYGLIIYF